MNKQWKETSANKWEKGSARTLRLGYTSELVVNRITILLFNYCKQLYNIAKKNKGDISLCNLSFTHKPGMRYEILNLTIDESQDPKEDNIIRMSCHFWKICFFYKVYMDTGILFNYWTKVAPKTKKVDYLLCCPVSLYFNWFGRNRVDLQLPVQGQFYIS